MKEQDELADLQIRLTYLEDNLNVLDSVVIRQAEQISQLEKVNRTLVEKLSELEAGLGINGPVEEEPPPPHY